MNRNHQSDLQLNDRMPLGRHSFNYKGKRSKKDQFSRRIEDEHEQVNFELSDNSSESLETKAE